MMPNRLLDGGVTNLAFEPSGLRAVVRDSCTGLGPLTV